MIWNNENIKKSTDKIRDKVYVAFDLETTGTDFTKDRVVEIGIVRWKKNAKKTQYHTLLKSDRQISPISFSIHGIKNDSLKGAPTFFEVSDHIEKLMRDSFLVGFNMLSLDMCMLNKEMKISGRKPFFNPMIDVQVVAGRVFDSINKRMSLVNISKSLNISQSVSHRAMPDAIMTMGIWLKIMDKLEADGIKTVEQFFSLGYNSINIPEKSRKIMELAMQKGDVTIKYYSPYSGRTERRIEPLSLRGKKIDAYCYLREDFRSFSIDNIEAYW